MPPRLEILEAFRVLHSCVHPKESWVHRDLDAYYSQPPPGFLWWKSTQESAWMIPALGPWAAACSDPEVCINTACGDTNRWQPLSTTGRKGWNSFWCDDGELRTLHTLLEQTFLPIFRAPKSWQGGVRDDPSSSLTLCAAAAPGQGGSCPSPQQNQEAAASQMMTALHHKLNNNKIETKHSW